MTFEDCRHHSSRLSYASPQSPTMPPPADQVRFQETRWSLISRAGGDDRSAQEALEELCRNYWYPVYAYVRRNGRSAADAEDLTQEFFGKFFANGSFRQAKRTHGKFRAYMLRAVKNQLISMHLHETTERRGGRFTFVPLDQEAAEARLSMEAPDTEESPERLFDREWAVTVVETVLEKLRGEYRELGKEAFFDDLQEVIQGRPQEHFYRGLAERYDMNENAARVAAHRLRARYGRLLEKEVADLLDEPTEEQVREEIRYLFEVLSLT